MAGRRLLRRSIRFSSFDRDILTIRITHFLVTTRITVGSDSGSAGSGRAIRSGDVSGMDLGTGMDSAEDWDISALLPEDTIRAVTTRGGRMRQRKGRGT